MILVTAPHACTAPRATAVRGYCDPQSLELASALAVGLDEAQLLAPRAHLRRAQIDYNRASSRGTRWRAEVDAALRSTEIRALIDVHTFDEPSDFELDDPDVALVLLVLDTRRSAALVGAIEAAAQRVGLRSVVLRASTANDLLLAARAQRLKAVLFELRSDLPQVAALRLGRAIKSLLNKRAQGGED